MQRRFLLDVVIGQGATVLQLLAGKDQALLVRRDALLVLNLLLNRLDCVARVNVERDGLARQGFDKNLHARAAAQTEHQVQGRLLLNVVVGQGAAVLQLLAGKDQALLVRRDALLVLDLLLDRLNGVGTIDVEGDGLARQGLDKDLHSS